METRDTPPLLCAHVRRAPTRLHTHYAHTRPSSLCPNDRYCTAISHLRVALGTGTFVLCMRTNTSAWKPLSFSSTPWIWQTTVLHVEAAQGSPSLEAFSEPPYPHIHTQGLPSNDARGTAILHHQSVIWHLLPMSLSPHSTPKSEPCFFIVKTDVVCINMPGTYRPLVDLC